MSTVFEKLAANFSRWESLGRGSMTFEEAVAPEPPFVPFPGHRLTAPPATPYDQGLRPTFLSKWVDKLSDTLHPSPSQALVLSEDSDTDDVPCPTWLRDEDLPVHELRILLPPDQSVSAEAMEHFLSAVSLAASPLTLELIGTASQSWLQLVAHDDDLVPMDAQLKALFPDFVIQASEGELDAAWGPLDDDSERLVIEFALAHPFMMPLASPGKSDPFVGWLGALSTLNEDETAIYQVIFTPVTEAWSENIIAAVTKRDGKPFFDDGADLVKAAQAKIAQPLYAVVVRLAARAADFDRVWEIMRRMAAPLRLFSKPGGNELMPTPNDDYEHFVHVSDFVLRRSRRCGMILNLSELVGFIRFPSAAVRSPQFLRVDPGTRAAAPSQPTTHGVCLGNNRHVGENSEVWLNIEQRLYHMHVIGASGYGKTSLLLNMLQQDVLSGNGFALLDPHGDLVDRVLEVIPPERYKDVVFLDPADERFTVPFNILSAHSDLEKTLLASDLVGIFRDQSTSWGDQMNSVFGNAIRAFLESSEGGTLRDLQKFLLDPQWRERFLKTVEDPDLIYYWKNVFPRLGGDRSVGPITTRLENFLAPKMIKKMVSHRDNRLDFADIMDRGKIFLVKLPHGLMGQGNSHLLGSLIIAKFQQMAMSRQRLEVEQRKPFFVYVDEFQDFICPSMSQTLSEARKYGLGFILAHQFLGQLARDKDLAGSLLSNAFTRAVFRVSDSDARVLSDGFAHFPAGELTKLAIGNAICRIGGSDNDFNLQVPRLERPDQGTAAVRRQELIEFSRAKYAIPKAEVEASFQRGNLDESSTHSAKIPASEVIAGKPSKKSTSAQISAAVGHPETKKTLASEVDVPHCAELDHKPSSQENNPGAEHKVLPEPLRAGKGGNRHKLLQDRIKAAGIAKGFRSEIEGETQRPNEGVDIRLIRDDMKIACEVSVTTSVDQEFGNILKCVRELFDVIAFITADQSRRTRMAAEVDAYFAPGDRVKIRYFSPDEFFAYLESIPDLKSDPASPSSKTIQGWTVKRKFVTLTPEERAAKTKAAFVLLGQEMKRPKELE